MERSHEHGLSPSSPPQEPSETAMNERSSYNCALCKLRDLSQSDSRFRFPQRRQRPFAWLPSGLPNALSHRAYSGRNANARTLPRPKAPARQAQQAAFPRNHHDCKADGCARSPLLELLLFLLCPAQLLLGFLLSSQQLFHLGTHTFLHLLPAAAFQRRFSARKKTTGRTDGCGCGRGIISPFNIHWLERGCFFLDTKIFLKTFKGAFSPA